jgi:hypothetical protein
MDKVERRLVERESLNLLADVRIDGVPGQQRVGLRNISARGLMADGLGNARRGQPIWICLNRLGWIEGTVAWVQGNRCGIALREEIDPDQLRALLIT